jgi:hypothetical protein
VSVVVKLFYILVQVFTDDRDAAANEVAGALLLSITGYSFVAILLAMGDCFLSCRP